MVHGRMEDTHTKTTFFGWKYCHYFTVDYYAQVIRVRGGGSPTSFLTQITCFEELQYCRDMSRRIAQFNYDVIQTWPPAIWPLPLGLRILFSKNMPIILFFHSKYLTQYSSKFPGRLFPIFDLLFL